MKKSWLGLLLLFGLCPLLPAAEPVIVVDFTTGQHKGIKSIAWGVDGTTTCYDAKTDRLVDGTPGQPRPGEYSGNSKGKDRGMVLESAASNNLLNSSFENGLAPWLATSVDARSAEGGLHGKKTAVLNGSGEIYQRLEGLTVPLGNKAVFGCLSAYIQGDEKELRKAVTPFVYMMNNDKRAQNLVWDIQWIKQPGSQWVRMAAYFAIPGDNGETFRYEAGLSVTGAKDLKIDAAQLEVRGSSNAPGMKGRWLSSYISTLDQRISRANEYANIDVEQAFDSSQGAVAVWYYGTNPAPYKYYLLHIPWESGKGLQLGTMGVLLGNTWVNTRLLENTPGSLWPQVSPLGSGWHLLVLSWHDGEGVYYADGKEAGANEGPFPYKTDGMPLVTRFILGAPGHGDAEASISWAAVYAEPLSAADVAQLAGLTPPVPAAAGKTSGIPVEYTTPAAGKASVGIYDKDGVLIRQVVMGDKMDAGKHSVLWDGKDDDGRLAAAGNYQVRGVVNGITCEYKVGAGNTGVPPWGSGKVCAGNWAAVTWCGDKLVADAPAAEFGRVMQCFTSDGKVLWTNCGLPLAGEQCALASDGQFIYVAGVLTQEYDAGGKLYFSDVVGRLNIKDGNLSPWPGQQKDYVRLPSARYKCPDPGRCPSAYYPNILYRPEKRLTDPLPFFGVRGMAVFEGKMYLSLFHEGRILVMDTATGAVTGEIKDIPQPQGVAIHNGFLYVASKDRLLKYDLKNGTSGVLADGFSAPYGVATGPNGDVYVSDLGDSQQVKVVGATGKIKKTIGRKWFAGPYWDGFTDHLFLPLGLAVDQRGNLTVADYGNSRMVHYDTAGPSTRSGRVGPARTTEAFGHGGMNGGVSFMPGDSSRLLTANMEYRNFNIVDMLMYRLDMEKSVWQSVGRWNDVSPVAVNEPIVVRRLENGRTYVYFCGYHAYMAVFELKNDNRLEFCGAFLTPRPGPLDYYIKPQTLADANTLGLVAADGSHLRCRAVWTDRNRNCRMEKDELVLDESWTTDWYNTMNVYVDLQGNILATMSAGDPVLLFLRNGFDEAGNPVYDWKNARMVLDPSKQDWITKDNLQFGGRTMDKEGNLYAGFIGGGMTGQAKLRLAKFSPDGRVMWKFGRKSIGLKDKPGEFDSLCTIMDIVDNILYVADYSSPVDLLTTDGLYLATLLKSGGVVEDDPYTYFGENFCSDVVKDAKTGKVYFVINPHAFVLPVFEVLGRDTVKRFTGGEVMLDEQTLTALNNAGREEAPQEEDSIIYLTDRAIKVDGDLTDWAGIPEKMTAMPDQEDQYNIKYRYACDGKNLYLAFSVKDPTPAINACVSRGILWNGDCLEFYFSRDAVRTTNTWRAGNFVIHLAAVADPPAGKGVAGVLDIGNSGMAGEFSAAPGIANVTRIWPDKQGYDLEAAIPLKLLGMDEMPAGTGVLVDWDVTYGSAKTQADAANGAHLFKFIRAPQLKNRRNPHALLGGTVLWSYTRAVRSPGEEYAVYARPFQAGWDKVSVQAQQSIPGLEDQYASTLKVAYDEKGLRFLTEVKDPTPGIMTAGIGFLNRGDWFEIYVDGRDIYAVATEIYPAPYIVAGGNQTVGITGATSVIRKQKDSYILEVFIPWEAVGGKKDKYIFNWRTGWSDVSGGAVFGERLYRPESQPATLVIVN